MGKFDPSKYVQVKQRLQEALPFIVEIITDAPVMLTQTYGYVQVTVKIFDTEAIEGLRHRSATGTANFNLALQNKSAQATNPLEDAETSALGRALVHLGFFAGSTDPSREEMMIAAREIEAREAAENNPDAQRAKAIDMIRALPGYKPEVHEQHIEEAQTIAALRTLYKSIA